AWVRAEEAKRLVVKMRGKGSARRAALLAPDLRAVGVVDVDRFLREEVGLLAAEQFGQEQPALAVEMLDLLRGEFHGAFLLVLLCHSGSTLRVSRSDDVSCGHRSEERRV